MLAFVCDVLKHSLRSIMHWTPIAHWFQPTTQQSPILDGRELWLLGFIWNSVCSYR